MSGTNFRILKQCLNCGNMFEAQKVSTKYCSHRCNQVHYRIKVRLAIKGEAEKQLNTSVIIKPKVSAFNKASLIDKEFLTVREIASLFNCRQQTVYSLINSGKIKATNLNKRKTLIKRSNIDKLFS